MLFLFQASMAEAEQQSVEDTVVTNRERLYTSVAAECKVSNQTLQSLLQDIEANSKTDSGSAISVCHNTSSLLPCSSIHRLGLGLSDLTLYV